MCMRSNFEMQEPPSNTAALEAIYRCLRSQTALERSEFVASLARMSNAQAISPSTAVCNTSCTCLLTSLEPVNVIVTFAG